MSVRSQAERLTRRWRLLPRRVRLLLHVLAVLTSAGLAFSFLLARTDVDSTGASLLVGVALAAIGFLQTRQGEKRQRTVDLISSLQSSDTLSAADCWMAKRIGAQEPVGDDIAAQDDQLVITLLDYYEFLCILAERGFLDGGLLADLRGAAMRRAYQTCSPYIAARRDRIGHELYLRFERFVQQRCSHVGRTVERAG